MVSVYFICLAAWMLLVSLLGPPPVRAQQAGISTNATTCVLSGTSNVYKRASCAASCYTTFCSCVGGEQFPNETIDDATEPDDFSKLRCASRSGTTCSYYTSCVSQLIDCLNRFATSTCNDKLRLSILSSAVEGTYGNTSASRKSCAYSACDLYAQQQERSSFPNETYASYPIYLRNGLYNSSFLDLQLRTLLTRDLQNLFPGLEVTVQALLADPLIRMDFAVNATATNPIVVAGLQRGQRNGSWLVNFRYAAVSYFGPRQYQFRSDKCFSVDRAIPYAAISGVPVTVQINGYNQSGCVEGSPGKMIFPIRASRSDYFQQLNFVEGIRNLWSEERNDNVGFADLTSSFSTTATVTVYCSATDTLLDLSLVTATTSYIVGQVFCIKPFPEASPNPPAHITAWLSTKSLGTLTRTLLTVFTNLGSASTLNATAGAFGSLPIERFQNFSQFQTRANTFVDGLDNAFVADSCAAIQNGTQVSPSFAATNNLVVVGANYYGVGCSTDSVAFAFSKVANWVTSTDVIVTEDRVDNVILNRREVRSPVVGFPDASGVGTRKVLQRYHAYRLERTPDRCTNLVTTPQLIEVQQLQDALIWWNGACDVTQCCVDNSCVPTLTSRSCTLPGLASDGVFPVTLKTSTGTTVTTSTLMKVNWETKSFQVPPSPLPVDSSSQISINVQGFTKVPHCFRLLCARNLDNLFPISNLVQFGDTTICTLPQGIYATAGELFFPSRYWYNNYYWLSVYGWVKTEYDIYQLTFNRPAVVPPDCSAVLLNYAENRSQIFALSRPFEGGSVGSVEGAAAKPGGTVIATGIAPVSPTVDSSTRLAWCRTWYQNDLLLKSIQARLDEVSNCFRCPARIEFIMPARLNQIWGWGTPLYHQTFGEVGYSNEVCYETYGAWHDAVFPWRLRCCYRASRWSTIGAPLIEGYPSMVFPTTSAVSWPDYARELTLHRMVDSNPSQICCSGASSTSLSCNLYRQRRSILSGITNVFVNVSELPKCKATWVPPPPNGWGRGDPYCTTFDGLGFECNFWGEALWTSCNGWRVHVSAVPVTAGAAATIINGVVVAEGNDTVVILRDPLTGVPNVTYNGDLLDNRSTNGRNLSLAFETNPENFTSIRVISRGGHEVEVDALRNFLAVRAAPGRNCVSLCRGLLGNCDGKKENDLITRDGSITLPVDSTGAQIFHTIVSSFLIPANESLFVQPVSRPPTVNGTPTTFTPAFITAEVLSNCPALCRGNAGCCLDAVVAGGAFAAETMVNVQKAEDLANGTIPYVGYNWPPALDFRSSVAVLSGLRTTQKITATDSDGVAVLSVDVCNNSAITCSSKPTSSGNVKVVEITFTVKSNFSVVITTQDTKGALRRDVMDVVALPSPPTPEFSRLFSFFISGTGQWSASEVYALRVELATDLASYVNRYYNLGRRQGSAPPYTTPGEFLIAELSDSSTNSTSSVSVRMYVLGESDDESGKWLTALQAQSKMKFPTFATALARLVPGATVGEEGSGGVSTSPPTAIPGSEASSSNLERQGLVLTLCLFLLLVGLLA